MKTLLILACAFLANVSFAENLGSSEFRVSGGGVIGFAYDALSSTQIQGEFWHNGTITVTLKKDNSGHWAAQGGGFAVTADQPVKTNNKTTVHISTVPGGSYDYTISEDSKHNYNISGFVGSGHIVRATLSADGSEFSAQNDWYSLYLSEDKSNAGHFDGDITVNGRFPEFANLVTSGTLNLASVMKADPTLFLVLYVLPFSN